VLEALGQSRKSGGERDPGRLGAFLEAVGARGWSDYTRGMRSVAADAEGKDVTLTPLKKEGADGLIPIEREKRRLRLPAAAVLGAEVRGALDRAIPDGRDGSTPAEAPVGTDGPGAKGFGSRSVWFALKSDDPSKVVDALGLDGARSDKWDEGLGAVREAAGTGSPVVFVTPAVNGWVIAVIADDAVAERVNIGALSRMFGDAQKFVSERVTEFHGWERWIDGESVRQFQWLGERGERLLDEGAPAAAERDDPDERTVMDVAAEWSVDPSTLDGRGDVPSEGVLGWLP